MLGLSKNTIQPQAEKHQANLDATHPGRDGRVWMGEIFKTRFSRFGLDVWVGETLVPQGPGRTGEKGQERTGDRRDESDRSRHVHVLYVCDARRCKAQVQQPFLRCAKRWNSVMFPAGGGITLSA